LTIWAAVSLQSGCGGGGGSGGGTNENRASNPLPGPTQQAAKGAKIALVNSTVFLRARNKNAPEVLSADERDLQTGDIISTDETGEAALSFGDCMKIYIYQHSGFAKGSCPKFDAQLGNTYCAVEGTSAYKDCSTNLTTQSDSAVVTLVGTWASHTYLPDRQLSVLLVFEGSANARPVTDTRENTLGNTTRVPALHFWFTAPNDRLKELAALNIGLEPRRAYPFERLPDLLARADLRNERLESVAEQAIKDGAAPESVRPYFIPRQPTDPGTAGGGKGDTTTPGGTTTGRSSGGGAGGGSGSGSGGGSGGGGGGGGTTKLLLENNFQFMLTKIGRRNTEAFSSIGGVSLRPDTVKLTDTADVFHLDPPLSTGGSANPRQVRVAFEPKVAGTYRGTLSFTDTEGRPYLYRLTGAAAAPELEISADRLSFNSLSREGTVRLKKKGGVPVEVGQVSFSPTAGNHFSIVKDDCSGQTISDQCEIIVKHTHGFGDVTGLEIEKAELIIEHDAPTTSKTIMLDGTVLPLLGLAQSLSFGPIAVNGECEKVLTLTNNGDRPLRLERAVVSGSNDEDFRITKDACSETTLNSKCEIAVRFKPSSASTREGVLTIDYLTASAPLPRQVKLSGSGTQPVLKFVESPRFGSQQLGAGPLEKTFTLEHIGGPAPTIKGIRISGPGKDDFVLRQETCTKSPVANRCEVHVAFGPKAEGPREAELLVIGQDDTIVNRAVLTSPSATSAIANQPNSTRLDPALNSTGDTTTPCVDNYQLHLAGNGYAAWKTKPERDICFGAKSVTKRQDAKPGIQTLAIDSESQRPLTPDYHLDGDARDDFKVVSDNCAQANKSCTLEIQFTPSKTKERRAALVLRPDSDTPPVRVELFGRGKSGHPLKRFGRWFVGLFTDQSKRACRR
jgi:hypothetical protein